MYADRTHKTNKLFVATLTLSVVALLSSIAPPAYAQSGTAGRLSSNPNDLRDSFARHPSRVDTPKEFAKFVAKNPVLGERYARHFGVPQEKLVTFFENALVPRTLAQSQTLSTFGVTSGGTIYPVKTTLPAGTKVWATREGVPVLKWNCSNPLTSLLPGASLSTPPEEYAIAASPVLPAGSPVLDVPAANFAAASPEGPSVALAPPLPSFDFGVPATDVVGSAALPGIGDIISAGGSSVSNLWPALFIPVILAATQGGNGGDTLTGETPPLGLPGGPVVVPEGNTGLLFAGGLPLLGLAFGIAKRRNK